MAIDLAKIRQEIDNIDNQLVPLLCERLNCSKQVAKYKGEHSIPVLNEAREREVIDAVYRKSDTLDSDGFGFGRANSLVYSTVMEVSRALQHRLLGAGAQLKTEIKSASPALIPDGTARIVCQGDKGAFSHEAANTLFPLSTTQFVETWDDVISAVAKGKADYGFLPVENSSTGSVHEVYDLIIANRCHIAAAVDVPVKQCLLSLNGATLDDIDTVVSHPQALAQCREFIKANGYAEQSFSNTATAAAFVAEKNDKHIAAIGSIRAAQEFGLQILKSNIQTFDGNTTRFVAISRDLCIPENADRITLLFRLPHVTGSLCNILTRFALEGLNLTKLESRPLQNGSFEYAFYLDFEGNLKNDNTLALLCALSEELPQFNLLGNYHEQKIQNN